MDEYLNMTKAHFDSVADNWDKICYHNPNKLQTIVELSGIKENSKIADIACGTGVLFSTILSKNPSQLWGIELSSKMLEKALEKFDDKRINLWEGNFYELEEKDFDCTFVYSAYPHFPEKEKFAQKLYSVLKNGGRFVVAHSESKHEINHRHSQGVEHVSDILTAAKNESKYFEKWFDIDIMVDTDDIYVISGTKH